MSKRKFDDFLQFIHLKFEYSDQTISVIPFYEKGKDDIRNVRKMDRALRKVQELISALINPTGHAKHKARDSAMPI